MVVIHPPSSGTWTLPGVRVPRELARTQLGLFRLRAPRRASRQGSIGPIGIVLHSMLLNTLTTSDPGPFRPGLDALRAHGYSMKRSFIDRVTFPIGPSIPENTTGAEGNGRFGAAQS